MSVADDRALTANRAEHKYLVDNARVARLRRVLDGALSPHHHASDSPVAAMTQHYATTVYFDTPTRDLYRAARKRADHTKLRAREYYDVLPLAELATNEDELLRSSPVLWLELKDRAGDQTGKRRAGVPKRRLHAFFAERAADAELQAELQAIQAQTYGEDGADVLATVLSFLAEFSEPLTASCIVNYRRAAWQNPEGTIRVTLDEELAAYAPRETLWQQDRTLTRRALGTPALLSPHAVVEVKRRGAFPEWLADALDGCTAQPSHFSKFVMASSAVHGELTSPSMVPSPGAAPPGPTG